MMKEVKTDEQKRCISNQKPQLEAEASKVPHQWPDRSIAP